MKYLLGAFVLTLFLSGCATQRFNVNGPVAPQSTPSLETSQPFFIGGIGQESSLNAATVCGGAQNVASVETEMTFLDGLLSAITGNIYTPRTAKVYCLVPNS